MALSGIRSRLDQQVQELADRERLQAPAIMMSQNRQESKDRIRSEHDYEANLKAEIEIEQLFQKLDLLRETQWRELVELQQRQIAMLEKQIQLLEELRERR